MQRIPRARPWILIAVAIALGGCAGAGERAGEPAEERRTTLGTDCFTTSMARDFRYLDDTNLIVFAPARQAYHVELGGTCIGLRGRTRIALSSRTDRMCGFAGEAVIVNGSFPERCPVLSVRRLDADGLEALLDRFERGGERDAVEVEIPEAED
jgi:hypothetical protein